MQIRFSKLKKSFRGKLALAVDDLEINSGEIVAVIGKNGSGKSTLIKILCDLLHQDEGTCTLDEISNKSKEARSYTKMVLESGGGYYDYLSAAENIQYFLTLNKVSCDEARLNHFIERLDFQEELNKKVSELS